MGSRRGKGVTVPWPPSRPADDRSPATMNHVIGTVHASSLEQGRTLTDAEVEGRE